MAKRELSSTLRNLKFMQRVAQKDEKAKKEEVEVIPNGNFPSRSGTRKWYEDVFGTYEMESYIALLKGEFPFVKPGCYRIKHRNCFSARQGWCLEGVVIVEGDPHPEAMSGRMSFLNFNPSVDKLNGEASNSSQNGAAATSSGRESETRLDRGEGSPQVGFENLQMDNSSSSSNGKLKRKQAGVSAEELNPYKSEKNAQGDQTSSSQNNGTPEKQCKREKLDWNVLRPSKSQNKKKK